MTATAQKTAPDFSYDAVPYESFTYGQTHPYHIATLARLFGMTPPDFRTARVLELGCASGGNLFSLALAYPDAHFTGLDLSHEQIALANRDKDTLGLKNISFLQQDIMRFDLAAHKGAFDYIICHGVLSWVPEAVQAQIFKLCDTCLSPDGLAVISYNTLPGWNAVRSLRDMMMFHSNRFEKPQERIQQARALLDFLSENVSEQNAGYRALIDDERALLRGVNDSYLFHDHLEEANTQFYFHQFAAMAEKNNLRYVGDAILVTMFAGNMPQKSLAALQTINDVVLQEQYMDFINNRRFRTSVICHADRVPNRSLDAQAVMDFYLTAIMKPADPQAAPAANMRFDIAGGSHFIAHNEKCAALFLNLCSAGAKPVAARDLVAQTAAQLKIGEEEVKAIMVQFGFDLALRGFIALHSDSPDYAATISEKPEVFALARLQAAQPQCRSVTNCLHAMVPSDAVANMAMTELDGSKTMDQVADALTARAARGDLSVQRNGAAVTDLKIMREEIAALLSRLMPKLAEQALLVK